MTEATAKKSRWPAIGCVVCLALAAVAFAAYQLFAPVMGGFLMSGGIPIVRHACYDGFDCVSQDGGSHYHSLTFYNVSSLSNDFTIESPDISHRTLKEFMQDVNLVRTSLNRNSQGFVGESELRQSCRLTAFIEHNHVDELMFNARFCPDEEITIKYRGRVLYPSWSKEEMEEWFGKDYRFE